MRNAGYYWVILKPKDPNIKSEWEIAFFDSRTKTFHLVGSNIVHYESEFKSIDTLQIKR